MWGEDTFKYSVGGYRFMRYPENEEIFQTNTLYPGKYMESNYSYTGDNILNEDSDFLLKNRRSTEYEFLKSKEIETKMSMYLKGKHPIIRHPPVQPEEVIEDTALKDCGCNPSDPDKHIEGFSSMKYDKNLGTINVKKSKECPKEYFSYATNPIGYSPKYNLSYWVCIILCVIILILVILYLR